jgi:hypothetical protein
MSDNTGRSRREIRAASCRICNHKERARVELLRVGGASLDSIVEMFGGTFSRDSLHRHFSNGHVSDERKAELMCGGVKLESLRNKATDESMSVLDHLSIVRSVLMSQFMARAEAGDAYGVSVTASRLLEALRDLGGLTGELRKLSGLTINNNTLNLFADPDFLALQDGLVLLARKHPSIREDVLQLLQDTATQTPVKSNGSAYPSAPMIEHEAVVDAS